jgi:hydroxypyruvate reductase
MSAKQRLLIVATLPPDLRTSLAERYELIDYAGKPGPAGPHPAAPGFEIAVTMSMVGAAAPFMDALPDLKLIACNGVGLDLINLRAAGQRRIAVCHTPDELTEDTADFGIALLYAVLRRTAEADRFVRSGQWIERGRMTMSHRVFGKRLGVVGMGKIGSALARRAAALGLEVLYTGPRAKAGVSYTFVPGVGALADAVDVLVLTCPGGEATRNLIDADVLEKLGPRGYLINIARGSVVNEPDLIAALQAGKIAGAGLDVFSSEPKIDERFYKLDNVVLQPHYACITHETRADMTRRILSDIEAFRAGRSFHNVAIAAG